MSERIGIRMTVNGRPVALSVDPERTLLELLREDLGLTGTKQGCGIGECGACTVLLDGDAVPSCLILAAQADGCSVLTVEGLDADGRLDPLQEAFIRHGAVQCGFCTPGMLMSAKALLLKNPHPTEEDIRTALSGNLCRCTGYQQIIDAVASAAKRSARGRETTRGEDHGNTG